jgi:hypothetical protein
MLFCGDATYSVDRPYCAPPGADDLLDQVYWRQVRRMSVNRLPNFLCSLVPNPIVEQLRVGAVAITDDLRRQALRSAAGVAWRLSQSILAQAPSTSFGGPFRLSRKASSTLLNVGARIGQAGRQSDMMARFYFGESEHMIGPNFEGASFLVFV